MDEQELCAQRLAEKRARRREAKATKEIVEIDPNLLACPSTELASTFRAYVDTLLATKSPPPPNSLECYQILLNSMFALQAKQYPDQSEQELKNMVNSLLHKIFQKMNANIEKDYDIFPKDETPMEIARAQCRCELLCLLEMHLLLFSPSNTSSNNGNNNNQQSPPSSSCGVHTVANTSKTVANTAKSKSIVSTNNNKPVAIANTSKTFSTITSIRSHALGERNGIINFIDICQPKQKKMLRHGDHWQLTAAPQKSTQQTAVPEYLTPTQIATKYIVARLRSLYLICNDPEKFREFLDEVLCDEFLEDLPFFLACIYEQLEMDVPTDLLPFRSLDAKANDQQEIRRDKASRRLRFDLSEFKNKRADLLDKLLNELEEEQRKEEGKNSARKNDRRKKRRRRRLAQDDGIGTDKRERSQQQNSMSGNLVMAPRKQKHHQSNIGDPALGFAALSLGMAALKTTRSPLKVAELRKLSEQSSLTARRRIFQMPQISECPENIGPTKDDMDCVEKQRLKENITTKDDPSPRTKFVEVLCRRELARTQSFDDIHQPGHSENEASSSTVCQASSSSSSLMRGGKKPTSFGANSRKIPFANVFKVSQSSTASESANSRKRPLSQSVMDNSQQQQPHLSMHNLLQIKIQQLEMMNKKPPRRHLLFPSSRSASVASSSGSNFPFGTRKA